MSLSKLLLLEFQSQNYLYHFTTPDSLRYIIHEDELEGSRSWSVRELLDIFLKRGKKVKDDKGISFTRNRELPLRGGKFIASAQNYPIGIVFDRSKLKQKYKIHTFDVHGHANHEINARLSVRLLDEEIILGDVKPVKPFIDFIYIPTGWMTNQGETYRGDINVYMDYILDLRKNVVPSRIPFKYFDKGNFQELKFLSDDKFESKRKHFIYKQLFEK